LWWNEGTISIVVVMEGALKDLEIGLHEKEDNVFQFW